MLQIRWQAFLRWDKIACRSPFCLCSKNMPIRSRDFTRKFRNCRKNAQVGLLLYYNCTVLNGAISRKSIWMNSWLRMHIYFRLNIPVGYGDNFFTTGRWENCWYFCLIDLFCEEHTLTLIHICLRWWYLCFRFTEREKWGVGKRIDRDHWKVSRTRARISNERREN